MLCGGIVASVAEVFISYRVDDAAYAAAAIEERLVQRLGPAQVFRDCVGMSPGARYPQAIREVLHRCAAMVAVIGPAWLTLTDLEGRRRIDNPRDWVRMELAAALRRGIYLVPLLLDRARMPVPDDLPGDIDGLALRQYATVRHAHLAHDVDRVADALEQAVPELLARPRPPAAPDAVPAAHSWRAQTLVRLEAVRAEALSEAAEPATAVLRLRELVAEASRVLGSRDPLVPALRHELALWTDRAGDPAAAMRLYDQAWRERVTILGGNHPDTNSSLTARNDPRLARRARG